ncbi:MAG: outer membrane beta-barrel protein [Oceanicoccus sp.]|jgi:outer membrane beta-barrel protein
MTTLRIITLLSFAFSSLALANEASNPDDSGNVKINPILVVEPNKQEREQYEAQIDTEFFELGAYMGVIGIENFDSSSVMGIKASFHATEDFFLQANYGHAEAGTSAAEVNAGVNMISARDYEYYNLLVGYNLFPGESFITQNLTLNSAFYVVGGIGNTDFAGDNHFTITYGSGYRIILSDWLTWNMDFRNHTFESNVLSVSKRVNNLEFTLGLTAFF